MEALAALVPLDTAVTDERLQALRHGCRERRRPGGSDDDRAGEVAELLDQALTLHDHARSATCAVCATPDILDETWVARTTAEVARLRAEVLVVGVGDEVPPDHEDRVGAAPG